MTDTVPWTGTLSKGTEPNTVTGQLTDAWGWSVTLHGERQADGSYRLVGTLGEAPACLRVLAIDGKGK